MGKQPLAPLADKPKNAKSPVNTGPNAMGDTGLETVCGGAGGYGMAWLLPLGALRLAGVCSEWNLKRNLVDPARLASDAPSPTRWCHWPSDAYSTLHDEGRIGSQERRRDAFQGVPSGKAFCLELACFFTQSQRNKAHHSVLGRDSCSCFGSGFTETLRRSSHTSRSIRRLWLNRDATWANTVTNTRTAIIKPKTTATPSRVEMVGMAYSARLRAIAASFSASLIGTRSLSSRPVTTRTYVRLDSSQKLEPGTYRLAA